MENEIQFGTQRLRTKSQVPFLRGDGEIYVFAHWLFCMEFNVQLLFEAFLGILRIFSSVESPKWIYLPVFEYYNISKDGNLWSPYLHSWGR